MSTEDMTMDSVVRNIRQLKRGVEADVTLGIGSVPSASITMKVVLGPTDPEWRAIQALLDQLFARRATEHVQGVVQYAKERERRQARATAKAALPQAKTA